MGDYSFRNKSTVHKANICIPAKTISNSDKSQKNDSDICHLPNSWQVGWKKDVKARSESHLEGLGMSVHLLHIHYKILRMSERRP